MRIFPSRRLARLVGVTIAATLFAAAFSYLAWLFHFRLDGRIDYIYAGDYRKEGDPPLLIGLAGRPFSMYGAEQMPLMLPLALLVRLPALAVSGAFGLNDEMTTRYLVGCIASIVVAMLAVIYAIGIRGRRNLWEGAALACGLAFCGLSGAALMRGHPEELLGTGFLLAGLLLAYKSRMLAGAALCGLAFATKQPFLLAGPTLLLLCPRGLRLRALAVCAGVFVLFTIPWIALDIGHVLDINTSVAADPATVPPGRIGNLWRAFELWDLRHLNRPLIYLLALLLPLGLASRRGWKLGPIEATAALGIVMIARTILDPFNIDYYALPAAGCLLALDYMLWRDDRHPLKRLRIAGRRLPVFLPVFGLLGAELLDTANGGRLSVIAGELFGATRGTETVIACLILIGMLAPIAGGLRLELTRARALLWGGMAAVLIVTALAVGAFGKPKKEAKIDPPTGFTRTTLARAQERLGRLPWLGSELDGMTIRIVAVAKLSLKEPPERVALDYARGDSPEGAFLFIESPSRGEPRGPNGCSTESPASCSGDWSIAQTPLGPALLHLLPEVEGGWEAVIEIDDELQVVLVANVPELEPEQALSKLEFRTEVPGAD